MTPTSLDFNLFRRKCAFIDIKCSRTSYFPTVKMKKSDLHWRFASKSWKCRIINKCCFLCHVQLLRAFKTWAKTCDVIHESPNLASGGMSNFVDLKSTYDPYQLNGSTIYGFENEVQDPYEVNCSAMYGFPFIQHKMWIRSSSRS